MAKGRDQVDRLCEEWARVRRELMGIRHPLHAKDYLGAPRCTLAERRDLHSGSRSGKVEQHYPEVYEGEAFVVNAVFHRMPPALKEIMDWHYTMEQPRSKTVRADLMGISLRAYWERVNRAKSFVEGGLAVSQSVRT